MKRVTTTLILLALGGLLSTVACIRGQRSPCPGFVRDLSSPVKAKDSLRQIGEQKCKMALPHLEKLFDQDKYRDDVIRSVKKIGWYPAAVQGEVTESERAWADHAVSILRKGLTDRNTAAIAASVVHDWHITEARDDLIKVLGNDEFMKARNTSLQALIGVATPKEGKGEAYVAGLKTIEDTLIQMLDADPNKQGIFVNVTAARKLGEIKSVKAVDALINALFLRTLKEEKMYQVARRAILRVGTPALDRLLATLTGQNTAIIEYCKKHGILEWEWKDSPEIVQVVGDFEDSRGAVVLVDKLAAPLTLPAGLSEKQTDMWKMAQSNRIKVTMLALSLIGTDEVVPKLLEIIANPENDIQQRLDSATALGLMGSAAAIEGLLELYGKEKDERFRAPLQLPLAIGLDWAHWEAYQKIMKRERSQIVQGYIKATPQVTQQLAVLEECKDEVACWTKKLDLLDPLEAQKSALTLMQLGDKSKGTIDAMFTRFRKAKAAQTDLRRFVLTAALRLGMGDEYVFVNLVDLQKHEKEMGTSLHKYWATELEMAVLAWEARFGFDASKVKSRPKAEAKAPAPAKPAPAKDAKPAPAKDDKAAPAKDDKAAPAK